MPRMNVAGTGGGFGHWTCDYRVCVLELWSQESSGPRPGPDHGSKLIDQWQNQNRSPTISKSGGSSFHRGTHQPTVDKSAQVLFGGWLPEISRQREQPGIHNATLTGLTSSRRWFFSPSLSDPLNQAQRKPAPDICNSFPIKGFTTEKLKLSPDPNNPSPLHSEI